MAQQDPQTLREARHKMMTEDPLGKVIPTLAIPMIISMLVDAVYNLADTYFVSQLGQAATAAVGVNDSLMHLIMSISMGFGMGASSYISRLLGAKEHEKASKVGTTTLFTVAIVGIIFAVVCLLNLERLVVGLGATETSKHYAEDYATYILMAAPITCSNMVMSQLLRSDGSTKLSDIGQGLGCAVNIILDPIFINVLGLEVAGAAMATAISKCCSFVLLGRPFLLKKSVIEIKLRNFTPRWSIYKEIGRMGIPSFLRSSLMTFSSILLNRTARELGGDMLLAAISVGSKCMRFVATAVMGFGMGFQPVAGYCYGAKKYDRCLQSFWFSFRIGVISCAIVGSIMCIFSHQLVGIFTTSEMPAENIAYIQRLGSLLIRTQIYALPAHLFAMLVGGVYQALGKATGSAIINLSRSFLFLIPSIVICAKLWADVGLAQSQAVADWMGLIAAVPMFFVIKHMLAKEKAAHEAEQAAVTQ